MKKFLCGVLLLATWGALQAHWEDEFDLETGLVTKVVHCYENPALNTLEARNRFRNNFHVETDRLRYTALVPQHTEILFSELFSNEQTMTYYESGKPKDHTYVEECAKLWVNRWDTTPFTWCVVFEKTTGTFVGSAGATYHGEHAATEMAGWRTSPPDVVEMAALLTPAAEKQGYMSEAALGILPHLQKSIRNYGYPITTFGVRVDPDNKRSIALSERAGLVHVPSKDYFNETFQRPRLWFEAKLDEVIAKLFPTSTGASDLEG